MTGVSGSGLLAACGMHRISPNSEEEPLETKTKLSDAWADWQVRAGEGTAALTAQELHCLNLE